MSANKEKRVKATSNNTKSFRHQHSSLQVNLSHTSSLTNSTNDSGNNSDNDSIGHRINVNYDTSGTTSYDIPLKNVSVLLQRISTDNVMLNSNSESLFVKNTALAKSGKQMSNKQEELLSIKTCEILDIRSNRSNELTNNDTRYSNKRNELSFAVSNATSKIKRKGGKNCLHQNICSTPKDKYKNKNINKPNEPDKLRERSLNLKKHLNNMSATGNNMNLKGHTSKHRLTQPENKNRSNCTASTETNQIFHSYNKKNNCKHNCCIIRKDKSLPILNISESESTFITVPIGCSTMINDTQLNIDEEIYPKNANSLSLVSNIIENTVTEHSSLQEISKNNHKSDYLIKTLRRENVDDTCQFSCNNSKVMGNDNLSESDNTVQTSLNVNTSTDQINNSNKYKSKYKWKNSESKQKDVPLVGVNVMQESLNTTCTSLQMNTSIDTSNRLRKNNNVIKTFSMKSVNLIEKQKNGFNLYSTKNNDLDGQKSNNYEMQHEDELVLEKIASNILGLHKSSCKISHTGRQTSASIEESNDKNGTKRDQTVKYSVTTPDKRKCKRKLLPLCECSQLLSISPVEQREYSPPRCLIFRKKRKRLKNRHDKVVNVGNIELIKRKSILDHNEKKQRKPKKVISKKIVVKKIVDEDILRKLNENKENFNKLETADICTSGRNSLDDFEPLKKSSTVQFTKNKQIQRLNIVATGLSNEDKDMVKSVVKALGYAKIESHVTKNTTHVVTTGIRTINLLHGIIRGCWLVSLEWVLKSLESNMWLNPETYEMVHFSKAVLENRKDRQLFGKSYIPELFAACGYIYVEQNTTPPYNILKDLIKTAGGCITESPETAKILIGTGGIKETWILDCITSGELQPYSQYQHR